MSQSLAYASESIGSIMSTAVPTCLRNDSLSDILRHMASKRWDSITNVYVLDGDRKLLGFIDMTALIQSDHSVKASSLMRPIAISLHPSADQEKAVFLAVKDDVISIPVIDEHDTFLGAVTAHRIIDIMHDEHIEDAMLTSGIRRRKGVDMAKLVTERTGLIVKSRAPWLIFGAVMGLGLGLISSLFEQTLAKNVAVAYFVPVVAYIADSVGTQSEAITIRALATVKINYVSYLLRELLIGVVLGVMLGAMGAVGAALISPSANIALVVGLSLFAASTIACIMASLIPITFKALGKDPALGSGPLATALQDLISVLIYFVFAVVLL
jgi:magnesium transporter